MKINLIAWEMTYMIKSNVWDCCALNASRDSITFVGKLQLKE